MTVARAVWELLKARIALLRLRSTDVMTLNAVSMQFPESRRCEAKQTHALRNKVAVAVPYLARFVPWRSDCLVQALAARNWLNSCGIKSEIRVGARLSGASSLDAHAWLVSGEDVITGGRFEDYALFIGSRQDVPLSSPQVFETDLIEGSKQD